MCAATPTDDGSSSASVVSTAKLSNSPLRLFFPLVVDNTSTHFVLFSPLFSERKLFLKENQCRPEPDRVFCLGLTDGTGRRADKAQAGAQLEFASRSA